jgi:PAS domain S-box-containing protein
MKILIASNNAQDLSIGGSMLAADYPDAERIYISGMQNLVQALQEEKIDLVVADHHLDWIDRLGLLRQVQHHRPGLPIILVGKSSSPVLSNIEASFYQDYPIIDSLLDTPTDLILLVDAQRKVLYANRTFYQRSGKRPEEVSGRTLFDILPPALAEKRDAALRQVLETGETLRFEDHGVGGWLDSTIFPIVDPQGRITHAMVYAHDISDRKKLEDDLHESHATIDALLNASEDLVLLLDREGKILTANRTFSQRFNLQDQVNEAKGLSLNDYLPDDLAQARFDIVKQVFETGESLRFDDKGVTGIFDSMVYPILDSQSKVMSVAVFARDITERKQIELALQESEQRYRALVETSPNGIIYYKLEDDTESRPLIVNQRFATLFGYENAQEVMNLVQTEYDLVVEQDHPWLEQIIQAGLQDGYARDAIITGRRKDGSTFQLEANGSMVYDQNGKPQGFLGVCRDVTERILMQQELVRAQETLEQRVIERTEELQALNRQLQKEVYLRKEAENNWKRHAMHNEALARVTSRANAHLGIKAVMQAICEEVLRALPYPICSISMYHEEDDTLRIDAYASRVTTTMDGVPPTPRTQYLENLKQYGDMIVIPDIRTLPIGSQIGEAASVDLCTVVSLPLYHETDLIGLLNLGSVKDTQLPSDDDLSLLRAIAAQAALSITNALLFNRVSESQIQLKTLTARLVAVQEAENRRLARELHDEIGQMLTSLSLNLDIVSRLLQGSEANPGIHFELERIRRQVTQLLDQVRDLSLNLLPGMLDDLGLLPTLLDHCQRFTSQTGILVNLSHHGLEERLPALVEIAAYRIVQEALTNVARHAGVTSAEVRLWATPQLLGVQIEDQGAGFEPQKVEEAHRSIGITSMRERAASCGGKLEIESMPGKGSCVTAEFPLNHPAQPEGQG